jgi:hypothetical protein
MLKKDQSTFENIYIAGFLFLKFFCYEVIVKQIFINGPLTTTDMQYVPGHTPMTHGGGIRLAHPRRHIHIIPP